MKQKNIRLYEWVVHEYIKLRALGQKLHKHDNMNEIWLNKRVYDFMNEQ